VLGLNNALDALLGGFEGLPTVDDQLNTPSMTTLTDTPGWQSVNSPYSWRFKWPISSPEQPSEPG
jgi:hypothetical protein